MTDYSYHHMVPKYLEDVAEEQHRKVALREWERAARKAGLFPYPNHATVTRQEPGRLFGEAGASLVDYYGQELAYVLRVEGPA